MSSPCVVIPYSFFLCACSVRTTQASPTDLHDALEKTREAYVYFRSIPAPRRGEIIRQIREALAAKVNVTLRGRLFRAWVVYLMRRDGCSAMSLARSCPSRWARSERRV